MKEKGFEENIVDKTLVYLKNYSLIDDKDYANSFVKDKVKLNKHGPQKSNTILYRKGFSQEIIKKVLMER